MYQKKKNNGFKRFEAPQGAAMKKYKKEQVMKTTRFSSSFSCERKDDFFENRDYDLNARFGVRLFATFKVLAFRTYTTSN